MRFPGNAQAMSQPSSQASGGGGRLRQKMDEAPVISRRIRFSRTWDVCIGFVLRILTPMIAATRPPLGLVEVSVSRQYDLAVF
jgi:hypothetical protein